MLRTLGRHVLHVSAVLLLVTLGTQALLDFVPGSPAQVILGETADPQSIATVNEQFGFNDPLPVRWWNWIGDVTDGSFGTSYRTRQPVIDAITERAEVSVELAVGALLLALLVAVPLALACARRPGGILDKVTTSLTAAVISMPSFMLAVLLMYLFAIELGWFDVVAPWVSFRDDPIGNLRVVILPIITLALPEVVIYTRVLRSDLLSTLREDYVLAARARGLGRRYVLVRHALRPSSFSLLTVAGLSLSRLVGGTIIVESIFSLPGLGGLLLTSIQTKDLPTILGLVTFIAVVYVVVNTAIDVGYGRLDPRVRAAR